ncbi:HigA family addiction module antidote protein [Desulfococcaceae bacterium OttesenSCG-928-F15]|nr:HigA family addiction module antidote protein [Desulfococcaceae bacterium OttesenSCG-928-F15]
MPSTPIHPGELLKDEMDALNLSAAELARSIKVPANRISQILAGKRNLSADTALRLGKLFSTGPQIWLNIQMAYELDLVRASGHCDLSDIVPLVKPLDSQNKKNAEPSVS